MDLWDIHQQGQINSANDAAGDARSKAQDAERGVQNLQRQVDHLTLLSQALWELLREHTNLTEQLLLAKVADIDTRDGKADGKIGSQVFPCPSCGANCNSSSKYCTMCGGDLSKNKPHIFEA